jgi:hypothetical protein
MDVNFAPLSDVEMACWSAVACHALHPALEQVLASANDGNAWALHVSERLMYCRRILQEFRFGSVR